jgi:hypothetical protein
MYGSIAPSRLESAVEKVKRCAPSPMAPRESDAVGVQGLSTSAVGAE